MTLLLIRPIVKTLEGQIGGVFLDMKKTIAEAKKNGYPNTGESVKSTSKNYNCWGTCIALNNGGPVDLVTEFLMAKLLIMS